jgi:hypothetical protein
MRRNGLTLKEMAAEFKVALSTLQEWQRKYPEFAYALDEGRDKADARVTASLYQRALGIKESIRVLNRKGEVVEVDIYEKPDTTACIFWLKNRRPDLWRDVWRHEMTGKEGGPIEHDVKYANLTDEELDRAIVREAEAITGGAASTPPVAASRSDPEAEDVP